MREQQRIRAELERQLARHGEVTDQEHAPALLSTVLARTAEFCGVPHSAVVEVHRAMWQEKREEAA